MTLILRRTGTREDDRIEAGPPARRVLPLLRRRPVLLAILAAAVLVRVWGWPTLPAGLNQDEISSAYEAWSLLRTGADRWGHAWPAYFLSWGSGQNVLYSYLTIPFVAVLGPVGAAARAVQLLASLAAVPLAYRVAEDARARSGIWAMLVVAVCPWQFMLAHWGLESNLLPTVVLLGLVLLQRALRTRRTWPVLLAFLPFAVALYAYATFLVPAAVLSVLVVVRHRRDLARRPIPWIVAGVLAMVVATPFLLFVLKAYVVHGPLDVESALPFTLPDLTASRLDQIADTEGTAFPLIGNIAFVLNGFPDAQPWNAVTGAAPLAVPVVLLGIAETGVVLVAAARSRSVRGITLVELLVLASSSLLVVLPVNLNQANLLVMALALAGGKGVARLLEVVPEPRARRVVAAVVATAVLVPSLIAFTEFTGSEHAQATAPAFTPGARDAIRRAAALSPDDPLYVTWAIPLNYVQTLWYLRIPPQEFAESGATPDAPDFGRYKFGDPIDLPRFAFVVRSDQATPCPDVQQLDERDGFTVGVCPNGA